MKIPLYITRTITSAGHLAASSLATPAITDVLMTLANDMVNMAWQVEYRKLKGGTPPEHLMTAVGAFWDRVSNELVCTVDAPLHRFNAVYGETVNPPGQEGNVHIDFQVPNSVCYYLMKLSATSKTSAEHLKTHENPENPANS